MPTPAAEQLDRVQRYLREQRRLPEALLKPLQDALGALNDVRGAHELLGSEKGRKAIAAGEVLGWMDRGAIIAVRRARKALARLARAKAYW